MGKVRRSAGRSAVGAVSACVACALIVSSPACGRANSAGPSEPGGDAGALSSEAGGATSPAPAALAGRWWGWLPFGSPLASSSLPVLVALEVDAASGGAPASAWPARFWVDGRATSLSVSASSSGSTFVLSGAAPLSVPCGVASPTPVLVPNGNTLNLQIDATACGGSSTQTVGTLTRSSAQRVAPAMQWVNVAATAPDARYFPFVAAGHPFLWDAARASLVDLAPSIADGGALGTGALYLTLAPGDAHAVYCLEGGDSGSDLVDFDVARGVATTIDAHVDCDAPDLVFSADGSRLAYAVLTTGQPTVDLRVRDLTRGASVTAYHGAATDAPYWFSAGASGRYLVYYATTSTTLGIGGEFYTPLEVYDAQTGQSQSLGEARYLTASPDGRFLAFSRSDGQLAIWSEAAGAVTAVDGLADQGATGSYVTSTNNTEYVPLGLSPDGSQLLYVDAAYALRLLPFGSLTPRAAGASIGCGSDPTPTGTGTGVFSDDGQSLEYFSTTGCSGPTPGYTAHAFGLASGSDVAVTLPALADEPTPAAVTPKGTLAYAYEADLGNAQVHVWSAGAGDVLVQPNAGTLDDPMFGISDDGDRLFFRQSGGGTSQSDMLWDRTLGLVTLGSDVPIANPDFPLDYFLPIFDRPSGIALTLDATAGTFVVSRPGAPPAVSVKPDAGVPPVWSATRRTVAVTGTLGAHHGVFTYSFASGAAEDFIEGGTVVATNDAAVYFIAADGLCVVQLP